MRASCSLKAGLWPKPIGLVQRSAATWRCRLHSSPRALVTTVASRVLLRRVRNCRSYYYYYYNNGSHLPFTILHYTTGFLLKNVILCTGMFTKTSTAIHWCLLSCYLNIKLYSLCCSSTAVDCEHFWHDLKTCLHCINLRLLTTYYLLLTVYFLCSFSCFKEMH